MSAQPARSLVGAFLVVGIHAACSSGGAPEASKPETTDAGTSEPGTSLGDGGGANGERREASAPIVDASADIGEAGAPEDRCKRYGEHVAQCYNGSASYYTGWCEWYLQKCSDEHIEKCVSSPCSEVKQHCGYC